MGFAVPPRGPAVVERTAELDRAWVSPGAEVAGTVRIAVLFRDGPGERVNWWSGEDSNLRRRKAGRFTACCV